MRSKQKGRIVSGRFALIFFLFSFFSLVFIIPNASAQVSLNDCNIYGNCKPVTAGTTINNNTFAGNSSTYADIWITNAGNLDNPLDAWLSTYNATYNLWAYNQTLPAYNFSDNNFNGSGNFTTTGTVKAEQLTSTDDITMAGYFRNVMGATDALGFYMQQDAYTETSNLVGGKILIDQEAATAAANRNALGMDIDVRNYFVISGSPFGVGQANTGIDNYVNPRGSHTATASYGAFVEDNKGMYNLVESTSRTIATSAPAGVGNTINHYGIHNRINNQGNAYNKAGGALLVNDYGTYSDVVSYFAETAGTLTHNLYGEYIYVKGSTGGTSTGYGLYVYEVAGSDTNWQIYLNDASANNFLGKNNVKSYFGTGLNAYITYDSTNLIFNTNSTGRGIAWFSNNVSAQDFIDRTKVYDKTKGYALNYTKDATSYLNTKGEINHSQFYGYVQMQVTDFSRPEYKIWTEKIGNETIFHNETYYPYKTTADGVSMSSELALLRQQVYELNEKIKVLEAKVK